MREEGLAVAMGVAGMVLLSYLTDVNLTDVKVMVFVVALLIGTPCLCLAAAASRRLRIWLMMAALASTAVAGLHTGLHFMTVTGYRGLDRGFEVNLTDLLVVSAAIGLIGSRAKVTWWPAGSLPLLALFAVCVASTCVADSRLLSTFTLLKLVRVYGLFWLAANWFVAGASEADLRRTLSVVAFVLVAMVLQQHYVEHVYAATGPMDHQNQLCLYVLQILPLFLWWALRDGVTGWGGLWSGALLACVVYTHSRAGLVLAGLEVLAVIGIACWRQPSPRVRRGAGALLLLCAVGLWHALPSIEQRFELAPEESLEGRVEFNAAARVMASEHWLGVGPNNFSRVLTRDWEAMGVDGDLLLIDDSDQVGVCHNAYWLMAAETGWLGLALLLWVLATFWWAMVRGSRHAGLLAAMAIGALALHAQDCLEPAFFTTPILYLFAALNGFAIGTCHLFRKGGIAPCPSPTHT